MSCMINSIVMKPTTFSTTTNGDLIFVSTNKSFFPNPSSVFSIQSKPIKPHLISCSISQSPFSFSAKLKNTRYPSLISFAFEDNTAVLGEEDEIGEFSWDNEDSDGVPEVKVSEWEGDVDKIEAVGDAGESADHYVKYSKPSEDCKVFVGNLSYDIGSLNLASIFDEAGRVDEAQVITNRETSESRGFGFVTMHTVEEAERAVKMFNGYEVNGRLLTVNKAAPRGTQPQRQPRGSEPPNKIYVGNLAWEVDNACLEQVFSQYGRVLSARVVTDGVSSRSKGFGFVTMSTESELNDAISNLDGQILKGREIKVNVAGERRPKSF